MRPTARDGRVWTQLRHERLKSFAAQKPLFVPSLKRDIVPPLHGYGPHGRATWRSTSEGVSSLARSRARWSRGRPRLARSSRRCLRQSRTACANVTGVTSLIVEVAPKRLELLHQLLHHTWVMWPHGVTAPLPY
jgi:hypothetical protein